MNITQEVELIAPGYRRRTSDGLRMGYWTPELARWTDALGFEQKDVLIATTYPSGVRVTGVAVNASPVIAVLQSHTAESDLTFTVTGNVGVPSGEIQVLSGNTWITVTGYEKSVQYGVDTFHRTWVTGGDIGIFEGTYNFEYEVDGTSGTDIAFVDTITPGGAGDTECIIIASQGDHKKVIKVTSDNGADIYAIHEIDDPQISGTVELWVETTTAGGGRVYLLDEGDELVLFIDMDIGWTRIYHGDGIGGNTLVSTASSGFSHVKITFNCDSNTFSAWVGTVKVISDENFYSDRSATTVDSIYIANETSNTEIIVDAIGLSWDSNYTIGDNLIDNGVNPVTHSFTIPAHSIPGTIWLLPNKRIYEITNVTSSRQRMGQPLTDIRFYGLADNGSKLLYGLNWNRTFDDLRSMLFGNFGAPKKCPTCNGTGTVDDNNCLQCNTYGFSGWNSTGYLLTKKAQEVGIAEASGGYSLEEFTDKIWTKTWWVTPTKKEVQRYFAHFAGLETGEVEIAYNLRTVAPTGVESIVDLYLPFTIPLSRFSTDDTIWNDMAKSVEPAGVKVRFSFVVGGFTGAFDFEDRMSAYRSGYISGIYTGQLIDPHVYGFEEAHFSHQPEPIRQHGWYQQWGATWGTYNFQSGHVSGDDAVSGYLCYSGAEWASGLLTGNDWMRWAYPETGLANDSIWATGRTAGITQDDLWNSGVFYWDNFWGSGANAEGCQF